MMDGQAVRAEACVTASAEWFLPWLWRRRNIDTDFAMVATSAWLRAVYSGPVTIAHPAVRLIAEHVDHAIEIFHVCLYALLLGRTDLVKDLFRHVFSYKFVSMSTEAEDALRQVRKLLRIVLEVAILVGRRTPAVMSQQLCMLIIRCFMDSLEQEWIPVRGVYINQSLVSITNSLADRVGESM
jgi:hypothetical protein